MTAIKQQKAQLRQELLQRRAQLVPSYRKQATQAITNLLINLPQFQRSHTIFTYWSVGSELATQPLIKAAQTKQKVIALPRVYAQRKMQAQLFQGQQALQKSSLGVLEPKITAPIIDPAELDLVIVPCLTCSLAGERLGYGGGYYDRYLQQQSLTATTVALCFAQLQSAQVPVTSLDYSVDFVITEQGVSKVVE